MQHPSVLNKSRKPIGYLDVGTLKVKWEAGEADPVRALTYSPMVTDFINVRTECKGIVVHD
jgi:hypothetical protein